MTAAAAADIAIVCVGTTEERETEGRDRATHGPPGTPGRVDQASRRGQQTALSSWSMPRRPSRWSGRRTSPPCCSAGSVARRWRSGLMDVLVGAAEPGGRLPTTHADATGARPSHANFPGENGELRYGEGLFMGYRGYEHNAIAPHFAFGHGMSYTSFDFGEPTLSATDYRPGGNDLGDRARDQYRVASWLRGRAVLRRAGVATTGPSPERAQGFRQGLGSSRARPPPWSSCWTIARSPIGTRVRTIGMRFWPSPRDVRFLSPPAQRRERGMEGRRRFLRNSHRAVVR